jgi:hypothetical protein
MAEHEFERFLEVLSKLLKLSSKETAAVADEICDHLEERYSELVSFGIARDDAVKQALDEFDDAGEFAEKLNRLVRQRTRRRIMTGALSTAAASALAILVTTAFWPDQRQASGPIARATAADNVNVKEKASRPDEEKIVYVDPVRYIPEGFRKPVETDLNNVELLPFAKYIQELSGYSVVLDQTELVNAGVGPDAMLTMKTFQAPVYLVLSRVLEDVGGTELTWLYDDGVVQITTREKADTIQSVTTVDVADLLDTGMSMQEVINVLQTHSSGPWQDIDGDGGSFLPVGTRLSIRQVQEGKFEVLSILEGLRTAGRRIAIGQTSLNERIREGLAHRVGGNIPERALVEVLDDLTQQAGIPFALDVTELTNAGVGPDHLVSLSLQDAPLGVVLKLLLDDVGGTELAAIPDRGVLWVTTREKADTIQRVEIFDISDLVEQDQMPEIVNLVENGTSEPWQNIDGDGGSISVLPRQRIMVRQTRAGLDSIQRLLTDHRKIAATTPARPKPDPNVIETRYYRMTESQAIELTQSIPSIVAVNSWQQQLSDLSFPGIHKITVSGTPLKSGVRSGGGGGFFQIGGAGVGGPAPANPGLGGGGQPGGEPPSPSRGEAEMIQLLKELLGELRQRPDRTEPAVAVLVIRQTRRVHIEIEKFLKELSLKSGTQLFDPIQLPGGGLHGGGLGGGGFGGGGLGGGGTGGRLN